MALAQGFTMTMTSRLLLLASVSASAFLAGGAAVFSPERAHSLYQARFLTTPPSVQECGDYLFIIVEGDAPPDDPDDFAGLAMAAQLDALDGYIGRMNFGFVSPFGEKLTARLAPRRGFSLKGLQAVTVEETCDGKRFRDVTVVNAAPVRALRSRILERKPSLMTIGDWRASLRRLLADCPGEEAYARVFAELGASVPLLWNKGDGVRCIDVIVDAAAVEQAITGWSGEHASAEECTAALEALPSFSPALSRLADIDFREGRRMPAIGRLLSAGASGRIDADKLRNAVSSVASTSACEAWDEMGALVAMVGDAKPRRDVRMSRIWMSAAKSAGRSLFDSTGNAEAKAFLDEAKRLYRLGMDLDGVLAGVEKSLMLDPGCGEAWHMYADSLRTAGRWAEAWVAYNEAMIHGCAEPNAVLDSSVCCGKLGFPHLAAGNAWWVYATASDAEISAKAEKLIRELQPDVFL